MWLSPIATMQPLDWMIDGFATKASCPRDLVAGREAEPSCGHPRLIVDGLENAPEALPGLLEGKNLRKLIVRVAP
jgi:NADPH-dependent curcumin reductase